MKTYPIYFVSLGPGDPEMITLQALKKLKNADMIFLPTTEKSIDNLSTKHLRENNDTNRIVSRTFDIIKAHQITSDVMFYYLPMSRYRENTLAVYNTLAQKAIDLQRTGRKVVFGVEGDITIYGSIHYMLDILKSKNVDIEQIAGINSISAAASMGKLSLVSQQEKLVVLPGTFDEDMLSNLLSNNHTIVIMKLSACRNRIMSFIQNNPQYKYDYFENIGTSKQIHLQQPKEIEQRELPYFSLIIIR